MIWMLAVISTHGVGLPHLLLKCEKLSEFVPSLERLQLLPSVWSYLPGRL